MEALRSAAENTPPHHDMSVVDEALASCRMLCLWLKITILKPPVALNCWINPYVNQNCDRLT